MKRGSRSGKVREGVGWALHAAGSPGTAASVAPTDLPPVARLRLEKRCGKPVTVAALEGLPPDAVRTLARELKSGCGSGGTVKGSALELQGDHRETLRTLLPQRGLRVKG